MAKITRPAKDVVAFASGALTNERTVFGDETTQTDDLTANLNDDYIRGWAAGLDEVSGYPPMEFFSGQMFTTSQLVAYLFQMGIAEWDTNQYYPKNALSMGSDGTLWQSLQGHSGVSQVSGSYWRPHSFPPGTVMVFSQASAPTGWTKKSNWAANASLIVGNTYGYGGSDSPTSWSTAISVGAHATHTHTGPSHRHTGPSHVHTGPRHNHQWYDFNSSVADRTFNSAGSYVNITWGTSGVAALDVLDGGSGALNMDGYTSLNGTGNTGAGGTGNTGYGGTGNTGSGGPTTHSVTQDTYTPKYQILIAATKD